MRNIFLIAIFTLALNTCAVTRVAAQASDRAYTPIIYTAPIPGDFTDKPADRRISTPEKRSKDKNMSDSERKAFEMQLRYSLNSVMKSGEIYFNDEMSSYINEIVAFLLKSDPVLRDNLHVYATRYPVVNARSMGEGTLLIDIGLIARVENEAQLAFVIAHEIAHYLRDHSFEKFKKNQDIRNDLANSRESESELFIKLMRHSRKAELQADKEGFLMMAPSYPPHQALAMLALLEQSDRNHFADSLNYLNFFNSTDNPLDSMYSRLMKKSTKDYQAIEEKKKGKAEEKKDKDKGKDKDNKKEGRQENDSEEGEDGEDDDELETHPDIDKRIKQLTKEMVTLGDTGVSLYAIGSEKFDKIRRIARFEHALMLSENGAYGQSLYESLQLLDEEPKNQFAAEIAGKSLFWLCLFNKKGDIGEVFTERSAVKQASYDQLHFLISKLKNTDDGKELVKVSALFLKKYSAQFPGSEDLLIHYGRITGLRADGKEESRSIYRSYLEKFPKGIHANFASKQLSNGE